MKKGIKIKILLLLLILIPINVFADECDTIDNKINEYNIIKQDYESYKCGTVEAVKNNKIEECMNYGNRINSLQEEFLGIYNKNLSCKDKVKDIINSSNCEPLLNDLYPLLQEILDYIYILAPILLIVFVGIDIFKILASSGGNITGKDSSIPKIRQNIFKRFIAFLLVYLTPTIVAFIISFNNSPYKLDGDFYVCENLNVLGDTMHDFVQVVHNIFSGQEDDVETSNEWASTLTNYFETGLFNNDDEENTEESGQSSQEESIESQSEETTEESTDQPDSQSDEDPTEVIINPENIR